MTKLIVRIKKLQLLAKNNSNSTSKKAIIRMERKLLMASLPLPTEQFYNMNSQRMSPACVPWSTKIRLKIAIQLRVEKVASEAPTILQLGKHSEDIGAVASEEPPEAHSQMVPAVTEAEWATIIPHPRGITEMKSIPHQRNIQVTN